MNNRKTLLDKQIDIEKAIHGTLRVSGIKVSGRISHAIFEARVREAVARSGTRRACRTYSAREGGGAGAICHPALHRIVRQDEVCRRLMTIPGLGPWRR